MDYTTKQLAELFKQRKNIVTVICNSSARAGEILSFRSTSLKQPQKALCLFDIKAGECLAIQSDRGNWFLISTTNSANETKRQSISSYYRINTKKQSGTIDITKEVVGSSVMASNFNISLKLNQSEVKISLIQQEEVSPINQAYAKAQVPSYVREWELLEVEKQSHYLSIKIPQKKADIIRLKRTGGYVCNCKPKVLFKFVSSRRAPRWDLSRFFLNPNPTLARTSCKALLDSLEIVDENLLEECKNAIRWRLVEVGASGDSVVSYGTGRVLEDGRLGGELNTGDYIFVSTYDYPGYMQLQVGCYSIAEKQVLWK